MPHHSSLFRTESPCLALPGSDLITDDWFNMNNRDDFRSITQWQHCRRRHRSWTRYPQFSSSAVVQPELKSLHNARANGSLVDIHRFTVQNCQKMKINLHWLFLQKKLRYLWPVFKTTLWGEKRLFAFAPTCCQDLSVWSESLRQTWAQTKVICRRK